MRTARASSCTGALLPLLLVLALIISPSSALSLPRLFTRAVLPASPNSRPISSSKLPPGTSLAGDFACRSTGECSPCPANELGSPVCKVYGNRRALTCVLLNPSNSPSSFHNTAAGDRSPPPSSPNDKQQEQQEEEWKPVLPDEATVEEALELDPDPEGLDDEDLQDALRGEADEEGEREERRRRRRAVAMQGRGNALGRRQLQEVYTWEACTRVVTKERADFFEFVLCNIFFAIVSVAVLIYRHRALASRQYGTLAARIGMSVS